MVQPNHTDLPPQLRALSIKSEAQPDAVRDALQATLSVAAIDATPEQVMADSFARLGYLPDEALRAMRKLMA